MNERSTGSSVPVLPFISDFDAVPVVLLFLNPWRNRELAIRVFRRIDAFHRTVGVPLDDDQRGVTIIQWRRDVKLDIMRKSHSGPGFDFSGLPVSIPEPELPVFVQLEVLIFHLFDPGVQRFEPAGSFGGTYGIVNAVIGIKSVKVRKYRTVFASVRFHSAKKPPMY